jgi:hypothetical protein
LWNFSGEIKKNKIVLFLTAEDVKKTQSAQSVLIFVKLVPKILLGNAECGNFRFQTIRLAT